MTNMVTLIGRLTHEPEIKELENDKKVCFITLAIPRTFKNADGIYETDFIKITLWNIIAQNTIEYCHKGDLMGVKGRLQKNVICDDDGNIVSDTLEVIAEKVTFLSSNMNNKKGGEE